MSHCNLLAMIIKLIVLCVLILNLEAATKRTIPNYIHICKRSDPALARCIRESVEILRPRLKVGIPELGVPGLEPLRIKEIVIFPGGGSSNLQAVIRDVDVYGVGDFKITKLKTNVAKHIYKVGVDFPSIRVEGEYDIDAKLLVVPLRGVGKFSCNITKTEGQGILNAEVVQRQEGYRQMNFTSFDLQIRVGDYNIHFDNLFNGDPVLSQAANEVVNDNKQEFIRAAIPYIEAKANEILLRAANRITNGLDYDKVFPEK